ncbi:hypothetical protein THASP1DRAFT_27295 [Thamnocephalis sphaerospora]|uniref:F-box domain-containing protein n=1 Tax=Thamnocephalis sphaerospora TaxID=78915 RepID=A0A4P9XZM1_9FUNG|nr:hypothetical protein THASP1DRAFT_27295 [Thamnocephalis sphaerospora]|eukprot:RKP10930.1 hypothetical protein THASP1DRAFT_27295 [Thamnocephalis sphaerospora]
MTVIPPASTSSDAVTQTSRLALLPPDVLLRLLVALEAEEVGRLAQVCRAFHAITPTAIYLQLRDEHRPLLDVEIQQWGARTFKTLRLRPVMFDSRHGAVQFRCTQVGTRQKGSDRVFWDKTMTNASLPKGTRYRLFFSKWARPVILLDRAEDGLCGGGSSAQKLFHELYSPYLNTTYYCVPGYIGDGCVIAHWKPSQQEDQLSLSWLRVSLSYILGNLRHPPPRPGLMYRAKLQQFEEALHARGASTYNAYDSTLLAWCVGDLSDTADEVVERVSRHLSRRQRVEAALLAADIDPACMWKYSFVQRFVADGTEEKEHARVAAGEDPLAAEQAVAAEHGIDTVQSVVRRIRDSEEAYATANDSSAPVMLDSASGLLGTVKRAFRTHLFS